MKKIIAMITALSLCTTGLYFSINSDSALTSITASAETDFEFDAETGTIYGYNGSDTDIVIPSEIDGVAVTGIANYVFYENSTIKGISIPDSVTTIGTCVFYGCSNLREISIPDSVSSIGALAFDSTPWFEEKQTENPLVIINNILLDGKKCDGDVVIPDGVTEISSYAFYECKSLQTIFIPDSVKVIDDRAFEDCEKLTSITIPDGVTEIGYCAFYECKSLQTIFIPESVKLIGDNAFSTAHVSTEGFFWGGGYWGDLLSISVDPNNKYYCDVDGVLFDKSMETLIQCPTSYECSEYHIPDGVKTIRSNSFYGCTGIDKIECPDSVITIESNAFKMFTSLGEISLSRNLKKIGSYAFENCRNLYEITIPESVEEIGYNAFFYADLYEITIENPDVELPSGFLINHRETIDGKTVYSYTGVINGKEHSTAQKYAEDNNIKFNSLGTFAYNYGDVTGDGIIDATDASFILTAYAKSSINEDDGMTAQQRKCADVNKDGVVDAVDASTVLTFYALSSTGNKQTFDEFVMSLSNL